MSTISLNSPPHRAHHHPQSEPELPRLRYPQVPLKTRYWPNSNPERIHNPAEVEVKVEVDVLTMKTPKLKSLKNGVRHGVRFDYHALKRKRGDEDDF
ncbi:hypothetical protein CVT24_001605 [Panaeolus cyanescens]|uniref:Uncharacterized protein n=1 Tax=Panaeolus cyanescens TaxID=181874 RepID=A0A409YFG2_9AGAR|nr:hypothetical protein CVT24_001605 [Panaeolus cyanescens]